MSGSIMQFNPVAPINPTEAYGDYAKMRQAEGQVGLIGQQIQAGEMQNKLRQAQLNIQLPALQEAAGAIGSPGGGTNGIMVEGAGSVPRQIYASIYSNPPEKWSEAISRAFNDKKLLIGQAVGATLGENGRADPAAWNQMVEEKYHGGWMTATERARLLNHPELAAAVLGSVAAVEQQPSFKARQTEAEMRERARGTPMEINVPLPGGGTQRRTVPASDVLYGPVPGGANERPVLSGVRTGEPMPPGVRPDATVGRATPQTPGASPLHVPGTPYEYPVQSGQSRPNPSARPGDPAIPPFLKEGAGLPGVASGPPTPTKIEETRIEDDRARITTDEKALGEIQQGAQHLTQAMPQVLNARRLVPEAITGSMATERSAVSNFMATFGPDWAQRATNALTGIDPSKAGATQELVKQTFGMVTAAESQLAGARVGAMLTNYFSKAMPNINMQGPAMRDMMNFIMTGMQMVRDYSQNAQVHADAARDAFVQDPINNRYQRLSKFESDWQRADSIHAPIVYERSSLLLNGKKPEEAFKGLTKEQQVEAVHIASRVDPEWRPAGYARP